MYALAVMISRSEDAVQTWNQKMVLRWEMTYLVSDPGRVLASLVRGWEEGIVLMSEVLAQVLLVNTKSRVIHL